MSKISGYIKLKFGLFVFGLIGGLLMWLLFKINLYPDSLAEVDIKDYYETSRHSGPIFTWTEILPFAFSILIGLGAMFCFTIATLSANHLLLQMLVLNIN